MVDETDITDEKNWLYEQLGRKAVAGLKKRNLTAEFVPDRRAAFKKIMELIPEGATVGWGDSMTLEQIGVIDDLHRTRPDHVYDPFRRNEDGYLVVDGPARVELMRKAMNADVFLSGVNAITVDGRLVSTDATGNRVAPAIFGPKKVIIAAGANKIVNTLEEALKRIKTITGPINARRHGTKHHNERFAGLPCAKSGECVECVTPDRMCRFTVIIEGERQPGIIPGYAPRMYVIVIGEELGV